MNITQILLGVILIIGVIVSYYVIPFLKTKIDIHQLTMLFNIAQTAVYAAEKIFGAKMGDDKLAYAIGVIKRWLEKKKIYFDEEQIRAAIEEQVKNLDIEDWNTVLNANEEEEEEVAEEDEEG